MVAPIRGTQNNDVLAGTGKNDKIFGLQGDDTLSGRNGNDRLIAGGGNDTVEGDRGNDRIWGGAGHDTLDGGKGNDRIFGGAGDDILRGGSGRDFLKGQGGADTFVFDRAPGPKNIDVIVDFKVNVDTIRLDQSVFAQLTTGTLLDDAFHVGSTGAADAEDRVIYSPNNGFLYYDPDGTGGQGAVQVAKLRKGLALAADDFSVVA